MKARLVLILIFASMVIAVPAFSQATQGTQAQAGQVQAGQVQAPPPQNVSVGQPNPDNIGKDQAQQLLEEVSVSRFEDSALWGASIPLDMGIIAWKRLEGGPAGKKPIEQEVKLGIKEEDKYVLGVRVSFFHRGESFFTVFPANPLPIPGIVKTVSVWVVGRNYNHILKLLFTDSKGRAQEVTMGSLNFVGWKQLTVAIPPTVVQQDYHYGAASGIAITGFRIETDSLDTYGTYYIYFDDLRAVTDLFGQSKRDTDDMADGW
ncbi:MAG TPA: flagellar filament outer layer protein FlaA [Spirochaetia bacterium]|nr:flagellar filament outer layer protein FlaA [Spirochaetia bacterium]